MNWKCCHLGGWFSWSSSDCVCLLGVGCLVAGRWGARMEDALFLLGTTLLLVFVNLRLLPWALMRYDSGRPLIENNRSVVRGYGAERDSWREKGTEGEREPYVFVFRWVYIVEWFSPSRNSVNTQVDINVCRTVRCIQSGLRKWWFCVCPDSVLSHSRDWMG